MCERSDTSAPKFEQVVEFIREFARIPDRVAIARNTRFEDDLGVTGMDGVELLEKVERRFGVELGDQDDGIRQTFGLGPNEYLFTAEGIGGLIDLIRWLGGKPEPKVRQFTVGELYDALVRLSGANKGASPDPIEARE